MNRVRYLVSYDICDPKRLRRVARSLEGFGVRLQYSVFECPLDELRLAKDYLVGSFPLRLDTTAKVADFVVAVEEQGLGLDYADRYRAGIAAVTAADVQRVAGRFFARELYGPHPYGRVTSAESYRAITRQDVATFAARRLRPSGALLVVAGDVTLERVRQLGTRHFPGGQGVAPPAPAGARPDTP